MYGWMSDNKHSYTENRLEYKIAVRSTFKESHSYNEYKGKDDNGSLIASYSISNYRDEWTIIEYSPEAEVFFKSINSAFKVLSDKMSNFLSIKNILYSIDRGVKLLS